MPIQKKRGHQHEFDLAAGVGADHVDIRCGCQQRRADTVETGDRPGPAHANRRKFGDVMLNGVAVPAGPAGDDELTHVEPPRSALHLESHGLHMGYHPSMHRHADRCTGEV
jgi:hypothetical protein